MLPPIPSWDSAHPLVVHFPIALLMTAPLLVVIGLIAYKRFFWFAISALVLMSLGTIFAFIAVSTGEAAGQLVTRTPEINAAIERHEELAETTQWLFLVLTVLFSAVVILPYLLKRSLARLPGTVVTLAFLLMYAGSVVLLVNTAHQGGILVHEYGVHALMAKPAPSSYGEAGSSGEHDRDFDD